MNTKRLTVPAAEEVLDLYFPVLDYGFVALTDYMGGDLSVEKSARVSYGSGTRKLSDTKHLLRYLYRHRHTSPFEQVEMQFHIGLPIFVMRQLVRHRTANLNEYSGRYSIMPLMYYTPEREQVAFQSTNNKQGRAGVVDVETYEEYLNGTEFTRGIASSNYTNHLKSDIARELARIDLPLSTYTFCYWKMDLRNMLHMIGLRSDPHAQWEIRAFSDVMAGIVQRVAPLAFDAFLDYQMNSVQFSQDEMLALSMYYQSSSIFDSASVKKAVDGTLASRGIRGREVDEFWSKLESREKRDFSLDLATAKSPEFYAKLMEDHSVEML